MVKDGAKGKPPLTAPCGTRNKPEIADPKGWRLARQPKPSRPRRNKGAQTGHRATHNSLRMTAHHEPDQALGLAPRRRSPLNISIKIRINTTIPVTSPKKQAAIVGGSWPKKTVVPIASMIEATAPSNKTSGQLTRFILCRLKSIPTKAKSQKPDAARKIPKNINP